MKFGETYAKISTGTNFVLESEKGVAEVVKELKKINADPIAREFMEIDEKAKVCISLTRGYAFREGLEQGREEGREEGLMDGKRDDALKMLADGLPVAKVCKYTGLSKKEVENLKSIIK